MKGLDRGSFLAELLENDVTKLLCAAVQGQRERRFMSHVATVFNMYQIRVSDLLFSFGQWVPVQTVMVRHRSTLEAADLLEVLYERIGVLVDWGYSEQQQSWLLQRLDGLVGMSRHVQWCFGEAVVLDRLALGRLGSPPYLLGVLFSVISPGFRVLQAARMLGAVRRGRWATDNRTFVPEYRGNAHGGLDTGPVWLLQVRGRSDMGDIALVGQGAKVLRVVFSMPWPVAVRGGGSHFLPEACRLERTGSDADRSRGIPAPLVRTPATDVVHLTYAKDFWERKMGNLPAELLAIIEGRYCISKSDHPCRPIFKRNLASWTDNQEAQDALWPEIAKMLWRGTEGSVCRGMRGPLCILAVGSGPKPSKPFRGVVLYVRPVHALCA